MDWARETGQAVAAVALVAVAARVAVGVPGADVPISLQTLAVGLLTLLLPTSRATIALAAYVGLSAAGLPLLSEGRGGLDAVTGASAGYLLGFVLMPLVYERMRGDDSWPRRFTGLMLGHGVILALGAAWIGASGGGLSADLLASAVWPFVTGAVVKSAVAVAIAAALEGLLRR